MAEAVSEREERILGIIETARRKRPRFRDETVTMAHGAGGKATQTLIEGLLEPAFASESLAELGDSGVVHIDGLDVAMTTDSFVVRPMRFPGGSIGELAVNGTVNDLAMAGARPQALSLSLVLEEGLPAAALRAEVEAIAAAAREAGVEVVTGDTKVVERGHADGMYICTTGIGRIDGRASLSTRSLWPAADALLEAAGEDLRCMRDATRGGVASALNELARASEAGIVVRESDVPVGPAVAGAAEMLGIDPMYIANEGKLVAFVAPDRAEAALVALRAVPGCEEAAEIGEVQAEPPAMVLVETAFGGKRVMDMLAGDPLPRIC